MENKRQIKEQYSASELISLLTESLSSFATITGVPVTCFNADGMIVAEFIREKKMCSELSFYSKRNGGCRKLLSFAGEFSSNLGEPYIFLCKAGFSNISVPVIISGKFRGFVIAGPFVLKKLRKSTISNVLNMNRLDPSESELVSRYTSEMPVYSSQEISSLAVLLKNSILSSLVTFKDYEALSRSNEEQRYISNMIREEKSGAQMEAVFSPESEKELVSYILKGDSEGADRLIRKTLDRFSIASVGNLDEIKTMSLWATATVVKSLSNELSARFNDDLDVDIDIMNRITEADSLESLAQAFLYIVKYVSSDLISTVYTGSSQLISNSLKYVKDHYTSRITLKDVCSELHVNPSYFSYLFSQEMGRTFVDYLTDVRLDKAEDLLLNTSMSILDISIATGFENQSYFTKVFKARAGITPRQYRKDHDRNTTSKQKI